MTWVPRACGGSRPSRWTDDKNLNGSGSWGAGIGTCCYPSSYLLARDNIVAHRARGIATGGKSDHVSVVANLVYDIHNLYPDNTGQALIIGRAKVEVYRNVLIEAIRSVSPIGDGLDMRCNTLIDAGRRGAIHNPAAFLADYNAYFATPQLAFPGAHDVVEADAAAALSEPFCFWRKRWTRPEQICIPNAVPTAQGPHLGLCDPDLGSRPGMGIDDQLYRGG